MKKSLIAGVVAIVAALAFTFTAWSGTNVAAGEKPVQGQMSGCNKCNKRGTAKAVETKRSCNMPGCDKTTDGKPCPKDCDHHAGAEKK